jgi:hypothetical protein
MYDFEEYLEQRMIDAMEYMPETPATMGAHEAACDCESCRDIEGLSVDGLKRAKEAQG